MHTLLLAAFAIIAGMATPAFAQSAEPVSPSVTVDPSEPGAAPHWTVNLSAPYCGGYRVGDGVYLSPEAPLAFPDDVPDGSVLFAGNPATVSVLDGGVVRVSLGLGIMQSMVCIQGDRPLSVELLPSAGFVLPDAPGDYAVDVWTGERPTPIAAVFSL